MFLIYFVPLLSIFYFLYTRLTSALAKLPGPFYTRLTSGYLKVKEFTGNRRLYVHALHETYGPVVRLSPNEVSFASLEAMKEIYTSGGSGYDRTEFYELFKQFGTKTLFSMPPKAEHSQRKRILADRYANTNIMRPETIDNLTARAKIFVEKCLASPNGEADIYTLLHCYALDGASSHLFGPTNATNSLENEEDAEIMKEMTFRKDRAEQYLQHHFPLLSSLYQRLLSLFTTQKSLADDYILTAAQNPNPGPHSVISKLHSKASDLAPLSPAAECADHLAAGIDTTGDALCFLLHRLGLPACLGIQRTLRNEILAAKQQGRSWDQVDYLDAVIKESLRCFPPIPMSFPRLTPPSGSTIAGTHIPGGTIVSCQPWSLHHDPTVFAHPTLFMPERWLDPTPEMEKAFFAFSQGARGCIGKWLALAEMKVLVWEVLGQVEMEVKGQMDMALDDQIISSRPRGQRCVLRFRRV